jgi:uncharacterized protein YraI
MRKLILALFLLFGLLLTLHAQDEPLAVTIDTSSIDTDVYITTQFDLRLREGPGVNWDTITTLEAATTLPAIGRTAATNWVQVIYEGQLGWVATRYVVWSGDLIKLPVDGRFFDEYVRRVGVLVVTNRDTPYYVDWVDPSTQVGIFPAGTQVEVVGRLGYRPNQDFNVMILHEGQYYWIGAWNLNLMDGRFSSVLDNAYRNAYTRLVRAFEADTNAGERRLSSIEDIWRRLQRGEGVSCAFIPNPLSERTISDSDLSEYPQFGSVAAAVDSAIGHTNTAIAMFNDACNRVDAFITMEDVRVALDEVDSARQYYNVGRSFLISLQRRDPLLGDIEVEEP